MRASSLGRLLALGAAAAAAACAGASEEERRAYPAWFASRLDALKDTPYPDPADVPTASAPTRPDGAWRSIEAGLRAEGRALARHPRNVLADTTGAGAFEDEARDAVGVPRGAPRAAASPPSEPSPPQTP